MVKYLCSELSSETNARYYLIRKLGVGMVMLPFVGHCTHHGVFRVTIDILSYVAARYLACIVPPVHKSNRRLICGNSTSDEKEKEKWEELSIYPH